MIVVDKFCKFCGAKHTGSEFPLTCEECSTITWFSPSPVAVMLLTVVDKDGRDGILIGRRTIQPGLGEWALPGGFAESSDLTAEVAATRELFEETGITVDPIDCEVTHTFSDGRHFLIFVSCIHTLTEKEVFDTFKASSECDAVRIAFEPEDLAFPAHTDALVRGLQAFETLPDADNVDPDYDEMDYDDDFNLLGTDVGYDR